MVAQFQRGLVRLDVVVVAVVLVGTGLGFAGIWLRLGVAERRRGYESLALAGGAVAAIALCTMLHASWDLSESRTNSFPRADERALAAIPGPLSIEVHLAPEDPRRSDLDRRALAKLRRVRSDVDIRYVSATSIGLFEQTREGYGEIRYDLAGRRATSRATTAEGVLDTIYGLAGVEAPESEEVFRGHPLAAAPAYAPVVFYAAWPGLVLAAAVFQRRRQA